MKFMVLGTMVFAAVMAVSSPNWLAGRYGLRNVQTIIDLIFVLWLFLPRFHALYLSSHSNSDEPVAG
ncbi:hypothetical protein MY10362_008924 [Beauveria mimosiformis]